MGANDKFSIPEGKYVDIGEVAGFAQRVHYHEMGTGEPVIFLHGAGGGASGYSNFKGNYPQFSRAGFRSIVPDLLGYGLSSKTEEPKQYDLDFFIAGIKGLVDQLGLKGITLLGNSLGGAVALGYALKQGKSELLTLQIQKGVEINKPGTIEYNSFDGVRTPHSDEWAFTASQQLSPDLEAGFSYVRRASRDGLTQNGTSSTGYYYVNGASTKAETATVSLRTLRPWKAAAALWTGRADFSWQNVVRNHDSTLGWESEEEAPDDIIAVNGVQMLRKDKPASGFYVPRKLSLTLNGLWAQAGVSWGNRLNWNSARTGIGFVGTIKGVDNYNSQRLASYMTWDSSVTYQPHWAKGVTLSLDILNVLNKRVPLAVTTAGSYVNNARWQTGREIWLTAGYQF